MAFERLRATLGVGADLLVRVPQVVREGVAYDREDRVAFGVRLVR